MKFGTFILQEVKERGPEALQEDLPFDEKELLINFEKNMAQEFGI
jgi:hypothetical protein